MRIIPSGFAAGASALIFTSVLMAVTVTPVAAQNNSDMTIQYENEEASPTASPNTTTITPEASTDSSITTVTTQKITGEVLSTNGNSLTVKSADETRQITVASDNDIQITRNNEPAKLSDIKAGDHVEATIDTTNNQALTLAATADNSINWQQWLIPLLIGGIVLIALLYWLIKRSTRQRIKTTTTRM